MDTQQVVLAVLVVLIILVAGAVILRRVIGAKFAPKNCTHAGQCPKEFPYCSDGICSQCRTAADCPTKKGYSCKMCLGEYCGYSNDNPCL